MSDPATYFVRLHLSHLKPQVIDPESVVIWSQYTVHPNIGPRIIDHRETTIDAVRKGVSCQVLANIVNRYPACSVHYRKVDDIGYSYCEIHLYPTEEPARALLTLMVLHEDPGKNEEWSYHNRGYRWVEEIRSRHGQSAWVATTLITVTDDKHWLLVWVDGKRNLHNSDKRWIVAGIKFSRFHFVDLPPQFRV